LFTRDVASVLMDLNDVEHVDYRALGGADQMTVNALVGTDVTQVSLRLAGTVGGVTGDALIDQVVVNGGAGVDALAVDPSVAGTVLATSNATLITISTLEPANDNVTLNGGDGSDTLTVGVGLEGQVGTLNVDGGPAADTVVVRGTSANDSLLVNAIAPIVSSNATPLIDALAAETVRLDGLEGDDTLGALGGVAALFLLQFDGGLGSDTVNGGNGADTILGGDGADVIDGNQGADIVLAGAGDDVLRWDPGDGSDVLEGQAGYDTLGFNASNGAEIIDVMPNGGRVVLFRNIGAVTMDLDDLEQLDVHALGGADIFNVDDLSATDVTRVRLLLASTIGGAAGDAAVDAVNLDGSATGDAFAVSAAGGVVSVVRGSGTVSVHTAEPASDRLTLFGLGGDDTFTVGAGVPSQLALVLEGGPGSAAPGDTATLTGDAVAETYQIAPNATRVALTRSVPLAFAVDLNEVEQLQLQVDAGADTVNTQGLPTTRQILDGGAPGVAPADTLGVAGFTGDALKSPILLPGAAPIVHTGFEQTSNPLVIEAFLSGAQETPPNPSTGRGFGTVTLSPARDAITVFLQYSGLAGNNTLTHIHGPALRRVSAAPIIDLPASGATSGMFTVGPMAVTPAQVGELTTGRWYFNVHSSAPGSSGGEIRGQLDNSVLRDGFE
jgi:Ca2+-binding RTX toxin-like protein